MFMVGQIADFISVIRHCQLFLKLKQNIRFTSLGKTSRFSLSTYSLFFSEYDVLKVNRNIYNEILHIPQNEKSFYPYIIISVFIGYFYRFLYILCHSIRLQFTTTCNLTYAFYALKIVFFIRQISAINCILLLFLIKWSTQTVSCIHDLTQYAQK